MRLRDKIRVDVLSGFLGSGKTTLLRHHLGAVGEGGLAILINELGATGIDHRLVRHGGDTVRVVEGGCACCGVADAMRRSLLDLLREDARGEIGPLERIVLETSGLANPSAILNTIASDAPLSEYLEIGRCVVAFDALAGIDSADRYPEVRDQLAAADRIVLTKADLADEARLRSAAARAAVANPLAPIVVAGAPPFDPGRLFDATAVGRRRAHEDVLHAAKVESFCVRIDSEIDWPTFAVWLTCLLNRHGARILRFKALIDTGQPDASLLVQGVRHVVFPPEHVRDPGRAPGRSDLVFIVDGLARAAIERSLERFVDVAAQLAPARHGTSSYATSTS